MFWDAIPFIDYFEKEKKHLNGPLYGIVGKFEA